MVLCRLLVMILLLVVATNVCHNAGCTSSSNDSGELIVVVASVQNTGLHCCSLA